MRHIIKHWRGYTQVAVFIGAELTLAASAEGVQKLQFIIYGTIANIIMALAFKFL